VKRGRRETTGVQERAWIQRHRALLARDADPTPRTRSEMSPEWQEHFKELKALPKVKLSRRRDDEVWSWIYHLLMRQKQGAPSDLMTCKLGRSPWNYPDGKLPARASRVLRYLMDTVAQEHPSQPKETEVARARRLFDAIRKWRADRLQLTE
jgi:hypothetical protein